MAQRSGRVAAPLTLFVLLASILEASPGKELQAQQDPLAGLDEYVESVRLLWNVPGIAVAVVKDDRVVLARGYGVKKVGSDDPADSGTLFAIASTSKAFTAAALGMLVDEGKLGWDDRVIDVLPDFWLYDPYVTRELTIRDLLSHRSGLPRGDRLWYLSPFDREEVLHRVRDLEPAWSFRSRYGYQNIMFLAAGEVVEAVSGISWDDFLDQRIFEPLGMTATNTSVRDIHATSNAATPHMARDEQVTPINWRNFDNVGGAGAINSSVEEMAQWIRLQLGEGVYEGHRLLSDSVIKETRTPHTVIRPSEDEEGMFAESHLWAYGLGWRLQDYRGRLVMRHGGALDGMRTHVLLVPEEELGVVAITNVNESSVPQAIVWDVVDRYLGQADKSWHELYRAADDRAEERAEEERRKTESERLEGTRPSHPLTAYAGTYEHPLYGTAVVEEVEGSLVIGVGPNFLGDLDHWHLDTFRSVWRDPYLGRAFVTFRINRDGAVSAVEVEDFGEFARDPSGPARRGGSSHMRHPKPAR
jgi:CubicO group peptidase (beta-lactamase class C family)